MSFVVLSAGLIYVALASLRAPRSHGFYRFFAWEYILALVLRNLPGWFAAPFAWYQLLSWLLLLVCLVPLILGIHDTQDAGSPRGTARDRTAPAGV